MRYSTETPHAELIPVAGGLSFTSSYDVALVEAFRRAIPADGRKWDRDLRRWLISPQYGQVCADLARRYLGVDVKVPQQSGIALTETRLLRLEYLGRTKDRGAGDRSAFGFVDGGWNAIFPEATLREWFGAVEVRPNEKPTLFATLGIKPAATAEDIKRSYRRLALQWHPDHCKEPDATDVFRSIQHAYEVLSNPLQRRKYEAGLALEAAANAYATRWEQPTLSREGYRSPLRCGLVLAEGQEQLGRFGVSEIISWQDIVNDQGQIMSSIWPVGNDTFEVIWL